MATMCAALWCVRSGVCEEDSSGTIDGGIFNQTKAGDIYASVGRRITKRFSGGTRQIVVSATSKNHFPRQINTRTGQASRQLCHISATEILV
jgi:hypothetical protein